MTKGKSFSKKKWNTICDCEDGLVYCRKCTPYPSLDIWAEKEKELELKAGNCEINYDNKDYWIGRLNQLRECKKWNEEEREEYTQKCAKDIIEMRKKRDEELEEIKKEINLIIISTEFLKQTHEDIILYRIKECFGGTNDN